MATPTPRDRRLSAELGNMRRLARDSAFLTFTATPEDFPEEYEVTYSCLGLTTEPDPQWGKQGLKPDWRASPPIWVGDHHVAQVYLPIDYPVAPPHIRFATGVFHPNLKYLSQGELERILREEFGATAGVLYAMKTDPEQRKKAQSLLTTHICLDGITIPSKGGIYTPAVTLYDICQELGHMIMMQRYNLRDPLDPKAAAWTNWARKQAGLLPIDNREFLGNLEPAIVVVGTQGNGSPDPEEEIRITVLPGEEE